MIIKERKRHREYRGRRKRREYRGRREYRERRGCRGHKERKEHREYRGRRECRIRKFRNINRICKICSFYIHDKLLRDTKTFDSVEIDIFLRNKIVNSNHHCLEN